MGPPTTRLLPLLTALFLCFKHLGTAFQINGISAGVDPTTGERPVREEINLFATTGAAFDLYILALSQLQQMDQSDPLSYFQIAGIHGFPQVPWDGVAGSQSDPGFCMHAAVPFPTWHRPYMVLFEQLIWSNAQKIARMYPSSQRDDYISAGISMRIPYWDWAVHPSLPAAVTTPYISVNTPTGFTSIINPLFNYTFRPNAADNELPASDQMSQFPWTVRQWNADVQQSNQSASTAALMAQSSNILATTYQLFTTIFDYANFSTTKTGNTFNTHNSIENIHNLIHDCVGGWGHMSFPEVSAFDPIFYLHHANVDRLLAMWQALYPDSYIEPTVNDFGSWFEAVGSIDSGNSSLAPFHSDNGTTLYTNNDVRGTRRFGYTYPELVDWNVNSSQLAANVRVAINKLYNPNAFTNSGSGSISVASRNADNTPWFHHVTFEVAKSLGVNNLEIQWSIDVELEFFAFDSTFTIDFFMGDAPDRANLWSIAPNLIGSNSQFIPANVSSMYPNGAPDGLVRGQVSLTHTIAAGVAGGVIKDMSPNCVVPHLAKYLNWKARTAENSEIDCSCLLGLSVSVSSRDVQPTKSPTEFPVYGEVQQHPAATQGKPGGSMPWQHVTLG